MTEGLVALVLLYLFITFMSALYLSSVQKGSWCLPFAALLWPVIALYAAIRVVLGKEL